MLASGLVTREQLETTIESLWPAGETGPAPAQHLADEQLANRLVEEGLLNRWQATEILRGHSKFYLGPYRLLDSIGQGGMGQVYKAEHTIMGRIVAVKVLPLHKASPEAVTGFMREIRAQAQLDHGNLVRALDAGYDRKVHYLVTEYVPGTDLRKLVRRQGKLGMAAAASIISQAAIGLEHAHESGLIHRDVKPGNILVTPEGRAKVSDLGLIAFLDNDPVPGWQKNKTVGTADYLSPEQIKSPGNLTPASDIYSLGCTLYYTVTGKVPFPGGTQREKSLAHCQARPIDPRRFNPELSDEFVDVIWAMMEKDVSQRISSAAEVVARLAPWVTGEQLALAAYQSGSGVLQGATPPPVRAGGSLPPSGSLSDTQPSFDFGPYPSTTGDESPSQGSQATHPVASASDETLPTGPSRERPSKLQILLESSRGLPVELQRRSGLPPLALTMVILGVSAAIACLLAIAISSL
ncbi:MAG: serine/threonine protein kinase [Planctomycetaceae bacterium]|nr:serine/threonine protein kinase [Planctomycetaceae bacterium]